MVKREREERTLKAVIRLLTPSDKRKLAVVFAVSLVSALIDVMGVGSIAPFLAVASNPNVIETNEVLRQAYDFMGFTAVQDFLLALGVGVIVFLVFTGTFKVLTRYAVVRFTNQTSHRLATRLMTDYLRQDYSYFLGRNSHELVRMVNQEIPLMVQSTLMAFVEIVGFCLQLALLIALLVVANPIVTLVGALGIGLVYGLIYQILRPFIKKLGQARFEYNREKGRVVSETFWGIKDTKLLGVENSYLNQFQTPSRMLARNASRAELVGDVPKFVLEALAFSAIIVFVLVQIAQTGNFQNAAVTVGLFAFAAYRMIPSVQNLFKGMTKIRYSAPMASKICQEFEELAHSVGSLTVPQERLPFRKELELRSLIFQYSDTAGPVFRDLSLKVEYLRAIGFAGSTGAGKTTLVDLILGLLRPGAGEILVDGVALTDDNRRAWQACIGYVPQTIYLSNASVAQNIAFGVPPEDIDIAQVEQAARMAQIHDFIVSGLVKGYDTEVGERGVRLSGGQRQRLGIARALYRNPDVLVFDEATSALDNETEAAVMEAVRRLSGRLTLLMIAHRLSTLKNCDLIYWLEDGKISDQGTFAELARRHPSFQGQAGWDRQGRA